MAQLFVALLPLFFCFYFSVISSCVKEELIFIGIAAREDIVAYVVNA